MNETFYPFFKLNEKAEIGYVCYSPGHSRARLVFLRDLVPRVLCELFDTQRETLVLLFNIENHSLHFLAFLIDLRRVLYPSGPGDI